MRKYSSAGLLAQERDEEGARPDLVSRNLRVGGLEDLKASNGLEDVAAVFGWIYRKPAEKSLAEATTIKIGE